MIERSDLLAASVIASRSLRANIHTISGADGQPRTVLSAGPRQLSSVWTRDACFAAGGLLAANEERTLRFTLEEIISHQRPDGLFPRLLDSFHPAMRYIRAAAGGVIPLRAPLIPNFRSARFVTAIDSNSLVAWASVRYVRHTRNIAWAGLVLPRLECGMAYYDTLLTGGLVHHPPYSDWKDTVSTRRSAVFFTQLLRWKAMQSMSELYGILGRTRSAEDWSTRAREYARRIHRSFWDTDLGFFKDTLRRRRISSDGNLAAIAWGFADKDQSAKILRSMDRAGLLTPWGPCASDPYPTRQKAILATLAGISGYHDNYIWLWNAALLLDALHQMGRSALRDQLADRIAQKLIEDETVSEVYNPKTGRRINRWLFQSKHPFSWSAAMLLEVFEKIARETNTHPWPVSEAHT